MRQARSLRRAINEGLVDVGGACDQDVLVVRDPRAGGESRPPASGGSPAPAEAVAVTVVDVLNARPGLVVRFLEQPPVSTPAAVRRSLVHEEPETLLERRENRLRP